MAIPSLQTHITTDLARRIEDQRKFLASLESGLALAQSLARKEKTIEVILQSHWSDIDQKGETDVTFRAVGKPSEVVRDAEVEFKRINRRSDVQARYFVYAVFGDTKVELPSEYWRLDWNHKNSPHFVRGVCIFRPYRIHCRGIQKQYKEGLWYTRKWQENSVLASSRSTRHAYTAINAIGTSFASSP